MILHLELPDTVVSMLGDSPERTIYRLIKSHLTTQPHPNAGRPPINAERDATIADKALAGARYAALANEYGLSLIRISQIIAVGRLAANERRAKAA